MEINWYYELIRWGVSFILTGVASSVFTHWLTVKRMTKLKDEEYRLNRKISYSDKSIEALTELHSLLLAEKDFIEEVSDEITLIYSELPSLKEEISYKDWKTKVKSLKEKHGISDNHLNRIEKELNLLRDLDFKFKSKELMDFKFGDYKNNNSMNHHYTYKLLIDETPKLYAEMINSQLRSGQVPSENYLTNYHIMYYEYTSMVDYFLREIQNELSKQYNV